MYVKELYKFFSEQEVDVVCLEAWPDIVLSLLAGSSRRAQLDRL